MSSEQNCDCDCKDENFYKLTKKDQEKYAFYADKNSRLNYSECVPCRTIISSGNQN